MQDQAVQNTYQYVLDMINSLAKTYRWTKVCTCCESTIQALSWQEGTHAQVQYWWWSSVVASYSAQQVADEVEGSVHCHVLVLLTTESVLMTTSRFFMWTCVASMSVEQFQMLARLLRLSTQSMAVLMWCLLMMLRFHLMCRYRHYLRNQLRQLMLYILALSCPIHSCVISVRCLLISSHCWLISLVGRLMWRITAFSWWLTFQSGWSLIHCLSTWRRLSKRKFRIYWTWVWLKRSRRRALHLSFLSRNLMVQFVSVLILMLSVRCCLGTSARFIWPRGTDI